MYCIISPLLLFESAKSNTDRWLLNVEVYYNPFPGNLASLLSDTFPRKSCMRFLVSFSNNRLFFSQRKCQ